MTEGLSTPAAARRSRPTARWFPLLLVALALGDLRTEFQLLSDHFTWTALMYAVMHHWLAVVVLLGSLSLWRRYR